MFRKLLLTALIVAVAANPVGAQLAVNDPGNLEQKTLMTLRM